jgi:hypothetical protein
MRGGSTPAPRFPKGGAVRDLEQRFGLKRIVFVGGRGMVTSHDLREHGHGYIVQ